MPSRSTDTAKEAFAFAIVAEVLTEITGHYVEHEAGGIFVCDDKTICYSGGDWLCNGEPYDSIVELARAEFKQKRGF